MAPGAYDGISAKIVEKSGFNAVYMTGSGVSMSTLGVADIAVITMTEQLTRATQIVSAVDIPLIADIDTGYGGPLSIMRTITEFEKVGVAGVQIEDQADPKRCGHELGRRLVDSQEMVERIKACLEARVSNDFVIIARTDSRTDYGINEAIRRGQIYAEAGADVIFVESPETTEELELIAQEIQVPTLCNMVEGGRTPFLEASVLEKMGHKIVIYPNTLSRTIVKQGRHVLEELKKTGTTESVRHKMVDHHELFSFFDYEDNIALERKFLKQASQE